MPVSYTERSLIKYSDKVIERFRNPRNVGEIDSPTVVVTEGDPVCGDMYKMFLKIEGDRIIDVKFLSFGCATNIATGDMAADLVKGKTIEEAEKLQLKDISESLGGIPSVKMHCAVLAFKTLKKALAEYRRIQAKSAQPEPRG